MNLYIQYHHVTQVETHMDMQWTDGPQKIDKHISSATVLHTLCLQHLLTATSASMLAW